jgi:predicted nucleotidyltransferase
VTDTLARAGTHNRRVFGSVARGEDTDKCDIDLLVDLDDAVTLARLTRELAELLGVAVDMVPAATLKRGVRERVLAEPLRYEPPRRPRRSARRYRT